MAMHLPKPKIAAKGQVVTCADCKGLIAHVQAHFTASGRVRT